MKLKITLFVSLLLVLVTGLLVSTDGFSIKEKTRRFERDEVIRQLNIEKPDRKILAPDFTLKDLAGKTINLRDLRGKVVFLNFWATWCPSCNLEMAEMNELNHEFRDQGLVILAIDFQEGPAEVRKFFNEHTLTFTPLLDQRSEVFALYQAWSLPTSYLIDKRGEIVGKAIGYRDWRSDQAKALFRQLLSREASNAST